MRQTGVKQLLHKEPSGYYESLLAGRGDGSRVVLADKAEEAPGALEDALHKDDDTKKKPAVKSLAIMDKPDSESGCEGSRSDIEEVGGEKKNR